jgi:hypothetical protein
MLQVLLLALKFTARLLLSSVRPVLAHATGVCVCIVSVDHGMVSGCHLYNGRECCSSDTHHGSYHVLVLSWYFILFFTIASHGVRPHYVHRSSSIVLSRFIQMVASLATTAWWTRTEVPASKIIRRYYPIQYIILPFPLYLRGMAHNKLVE